MLCPNQPSVPGSFTSFLPNPAETGLGVFWGGNFPTQTHLRCKENFDEASKTSKAELQLLKVRDHGHPGSGRPSVVAQRLESV